MSDRHNALNTNPKVQVTSRLMLPPHPSVEPIWASVNGAAQANVVVMATLHGEAQTSHTAFDRVSS